MSRLGRMSVFPEEHLWGGMSFGTSHAVKRKDTKCEQKLELENERLSAEVDRLKALVEVACPPETQNCSSSNLEVRRLKGQIAQLQRQTEIMDNELRTSNGRVAQYETILDEVCVKVRILEEKTKGLKSGAEGTQNLSRWVQETVASLQKKTGSHRSETCWEQIEKVPVGGNKFIQSVSSKGVSVLDTCDGSLLTSPSARRHIHRLHENLLNLVPQMSRHSAYLQSVLLPALPWMDVDDVEQVACDAESLASGLREVLGQTSDIAAVTPAQGLCLGKALVDGLSNSCSVLENVNPQVNEIVAKLAPFSDESDIEKVEEILRSALGRYHLGHKKVLARMNRMQLDFESLCQTSKAASKFCLGIQKLCRDLESLSLKCEPEVLFVLEGLNEIVQIADRLVESPSELLVRRLVDVILSNREDLRKVPEVLESSVASFLKVILKKLDAYR